MKNEIILNELANLMEIDRNDLNLNYPLEQYGNWDSLTAISTIALVDEQYGILLKSCEIEKCKNLNEIFELIDDKTKIKVA
jgi:acyl carrier protein